jgi:hypothetical protein
MKISKYMAYLQQHGEGCDYTIACGKELIPLKGDNLTEAAKDLRRIIEEEGYTGERRLKDVVLLEIDNFISMDINLIYNEIKKEQERQVDEGNREAELAELERLKRKYENQ